MNREIGKFKAKELDTDNWVIGYYVRDTHNSHYIIGLDNYHYSIDPSTLCQLITTIDDVEIYEYDCYYINNIITYFYYDLRGKLYYIQREKINNVNHITDYFMDEQYLLEEIITKAKFIGNWHDGEQYLLNKIKEVENEN
jgi:hypothetical protein